ncbi:hypothetical protein GCM10025770_29230 [Viridibacterium curvum]|uniref:Lipoprotein n=2 Tax=Viridibacterium curvum TaxID=1101404 RepID=A0ABP9QX84_9RHOO
MKFLVVVTLQALLVSCSPYKYYVKSDFSFYAEGFLLESAVLRTDGVYVLDKVYTQRNGYVTDHSFKGYVHFYKFFKTGQQISYLVPEKEFGGDYLRVVKEHAARAERGRTLFEGYYKLKDDRIILEGVNAALGNFHYSHGKIGDDRLEIISTASEGIKDFDERNLNYRVVHMYVFKPFNEPSYQEVKVDW